MHATATVKLLRSKPRKCWNGWRDLGPWKHQDLSYPGKAMFKSGPALQAPTPLATPTDAIASVSKPVMSGRPITCHNDCPKRVTSWLGWSWSMRVSCYKAAIVFLKLQPYSFTQPWQPKIRAPGAAPRFPIYDSAFRWPRMMYALGVSLSWSRQQWWFGTAQATHAKQAGPTHQ